MQIGLCPFLTMLLDKFQKQLGFRLTAMRFIGRKPISARLLLLY